MLATRMTFRLAFALVVGLSLSVQNALAQAAKEDPAETEEQKQTRQRMLDRWNKMRALLRVADKEQEVDRLKDPIFAYVEPARETGGRGNGVGLGDPRAACCSVDTEQSTRTARVGLRAGGSH
jgi:hypothetical protein